MHTTTRILILIFFCIFTTAAVASTHKIKKIKSINDFDICIKKYADQDCLEALHNYITTHPNDAMDAAKTVRLKYNAHVALIFFEIAQQQPAQDFCLDEDLHLAVQSGLALPSNFPDAARARKLLSGPCHKDLGPSILTEITSGSASEYFKDNACPVFIQRGTAPAACSTEPSAQPSPKKHEALPILAKKDIRLDVPTTYVGSEGVLVTVASIQNSDLCLVYFQGISGPWNGKSILHKRIEHVDGKLEYWTDVDGIRWVGLTKDGGWEAYAPGYLGGNGFGLFFSETVSHSVNQNSVLEAY